MLVEDFIQNEEDEALIPSKKLTLKKFVIVYMLVYYVRTVLKIAFLLYRGSRRTVKTSADRQRLNSKKISGQKYIFLFLLFDFLLTFSFIVRRLTATSTLTNLKKTLLPTTVRKPLRQRRLL
jgi:hypothetical protein